jgi:hypothetical protein
VTPIGFEPITCPLGGGCSIQLSHGADAVCLACTGWGKSSGDGDLCLLFGFDKPEGDIREGHRCDTR